MRRTLRSIAPPRINAETATWPAHAKEPDFVVFSTPSAIQARATTTPAARSQTNAWPGLSLGFDRDGDGIVDALDNCVKIYNPGQENEDGDSFGDICDPCPPVPDDVFVDADGDGIDDQCDPHVGLTDYLTFEGFHAGLPAAWTTIGPATWVASNDSIIGTTTGSDTAPSILIGPYLDPAYATSVTITAGITVTQLPDAAIQAGVLGASTALAAETMTCNLVQDASSVQTFVASATTATPVMLAKPWAFEVGQQYSVGLMYDLVKAASCHVARGVASTDVAIALPTTWPNDDRKLGIYLEGATTTISVDWVMFVSEH